MVKGGPVGGKVRTMSGIDHERAWKREQNAVATRWKQAVKRISAALYNEDPEGMGSSVGSPDDEYDDAAIHAMRLLRDRKSGTAATALHAEWPSLSGETIRTITLEWRAVERAGRFHCPCCGYLTLAERPPGTYDICELCGWEDDSVQFADASYRGGANVDSLSEVRSSYFAFLDGGAPSSRYGRPDPAKHGRSVVREPEVHDSETDWRLMKYGKREMSLVPESLRSSSWMPRELTLPLNEALQAVEHFKSAGVETLCWENLHGYPDRKKGGTFTIDGEHRVYGHSPDYTIDEVEAAMREQDAELRPFLEPKGECLLFCFMIMDGVNPDRE